MPSRVHRHTKLDQSTITRGCEKLSPRVVEYLCHNQQFKGKVHFKTFFADSDVEYVVVT